jgi:pSer/pThr/pTyr-binding forkhead associated (FHA) protein
MALLRYLDDGGRVQTRTIDSEQFVIGRSPTCQLPLDSEMISREHVRIELDGGGRFRIRDLGSRNKTFVNGEQITESLLNPGDVVRAGDRVFEFLEDAAPLGTMDRGFLLDGPEPPDCDWIKTKSPLMLTTSQIEQLAQLSGEQPLLGRAEDIADSALGAILHDIQAERGFIALRPPDSLEITPIAHRAFKHFGGETRTPVNLSFVRDAINQNAAGFYPKPGAKLNPRPGLAVTAMIAPLTCGGEITGVVYVDRPSSKKAFAPAAATFLLAAGAHLGGQLAESVRRVARGAVREGAAWMSTLRKMQTFLIRPLEAPDGVDVAADRIAGRSRCGDFSAVTATPRGCAVLVVDGGGHGVTGLAQAHAIESALCTALSEYPATTLDAARVFESLNRRIATVPGRQTIACTLVGLDINARKLAYINAGGPAPLLMLEPGRTVPAEQNSLVLGVDKAYRYETAILDLPASFRLVLASDGVLNALNAEGEILGEKRLREMLESPTGFASASQISAMIAQMVRSHIGGTAGEDDASWLVLAHR